MPCGLNIKIVVGCFLLKSNTDFSGWCGYMKGGLPERVPALPILMLISSSSCCNECSSAFSFICLTSWGRTKAKWGSVPTPCKWEKGCKRLECNLKERKWIQFMVCYNLMVQYSMIHVNLNIQLKIQFNLLCSRLLHEHFHEECLQGSTWMHQPTFCKTLYFNKDVFGSPIIFIGHERSTHVCMRGNISFQPQHKQLEIISMLRCLMNDFTTTAGDSWLHWGVLQKCATSIFYSHVSFVWNTNFILETTTLVK